MGERQETKRKLKYGKKGVAKALEKAIIKVCGDIAAEGAGSDKLTGLSRVVNAYRGVKGEHRGRSSNTADSMMQDGQLGYYESLEK